MKKAISRIIFLISLFLFYLVVKEAISFFELAFTFGSTVGYATVSLIAILVLWFMLIPLVRLLFLPCMQGPTTNAADEEKLISKRLEIFAKNPFLRERGYADDPSKSLRERYNNATALLKEECDRIRGRLVRGLFISSSISQNGFLDAILILSQSVRIISETFTLYAGRVTLRDLFNIAKKVYYSVVIGGSESVEYLSGELLSALAPGLVKAIPFLGKVTESVADGLVNATLLTRVSLITEDYCRITLIEKQSDLFPKYKSVLSATKHILYSMRDTKTIAEDEQLSSDALDKLYTLNIEKRARERFDLIGCLATGLFLAGVLFIIFKIVSM